MIKLSSKADILLNELRAECRKLESAPDLTEADFKYKARVLWWKFCQETQREPLLHFRAFWGNENTYQRTIA